MKETLDFILSELKKAQEKHPVWPDNHHYAIGIVAEECLEALRASNDGDLAQLKTELGHTAATCIRAIIGLGKVG